MRTYLSGSCAHYVATMIPDITAIDPHAFSAWLWHTYMSHIFLLICTISLFQTSNFANTGVKRIA